MFSFTTTIATFAVAIQKKSSPEDIFFYMLPFFILVPFSARITYYRIWRCYLKSYLEIFSSDIYIFNGYMEKPKIEKNFLDKIIGMFVNFEMFVLSIACTFVYYIKCYIYFKYSLSYIMIFSIPLILTFLIFLFCFSAYDYSKIHSLYIDRWFKKKQQLSIIYFEKPDSNNRNS